MYSLDDLLHLMQRLRDPETGCPWDIEQTFASIVPSTIEEAYEVADAIEREDWPHVKEELGDLLFQVVFYGQLGDEMRHNSVMAENSALAKKVQHEGFNFHDIVHSLVTKLVQRHPHVFPTGELYPSDDQKTSRTVMDEHQILQQWETIKAAERAEKGQNGLLDDVPLGLPSLSRALKLQKRAARVGFDWPHISGALGKIHEEIDELKAVVETTDEDSIDLLKAQDELGDVLFACVNLARFLKLDPDRCLRSTNQKFYDRFSYVETALKSEGKSLESASLEEMDRLWDQAKALERRD